MLIEGGRGPPTGSRSESITLKSYRNPKTVLFSCHSLLYSFPDTINRAGPPAHQDVSFLCKRGRKIYFVQPNEVTS